MNIDNCYASQFKNVIEDIVKSEVKKMGITNYISAVVQKVNADGTVNVYLPPNKNSLLTGLYNKTGIAIAAGDSVELATKNGSLTNAWVALRHGNDNLKDGGLTSSGGILVEKDPTVPDYVKKITENDINRWNNGGYVAGDTLPIGTITQYSGSTAPTNWLFCDGRAVSRTTYKLLFEIIGTTYGDGDGSTTFNLPDFRSRAPVGVGTGTDINGRTTNFYLGNKAGEYYHQLSIDEMPSHTHRLEPFVDVRQGDGQTNSHSASLGTHLGGNITKTDANVTYSGGSAAHNNIQPSLGINFIIKYDNSIGLVGTVVSDITNPNKDAAPSAKTVKNYVDGKVIDIEQYAKEVALYENEGGSNGTITLSDSVANYKYIEIFWRDDGRRHGSAKIYNPNGKIVYMDGGYITAASTNFKQTQATISGTTITPTNYTDTIIGNGATPTINATQNYAYIYRVVGYKQ